MFKDQEQLATFMSKAKNKLKLVAGGKYSWVQYEKEYFFKETHCPHDLSVYR